MKNKPFIFLITGAPETFKTQLAKALKFAVRFHLTDKQTKDDQVVEIVDDLPWAEATLVRKMTRAGIARLKARNNDVIIFVDTALTPAMLAKEGFPVTIHIQTARIYK